MTKYKDVVEQAFKGIPKLNKPKILSEYYGHKDESNRVMVVYNSLRRRYEVMHDGDLVDSCLTEEIANIAAEDYINAKKL